MDKRRSPRYAVTLNALVHPNEGRSWLCSIQDFCDSGMMLVAQDSSRSRRSMPGINAGEDVGIHFSIPSKSGKDKHFRLNGKIVRVLSDGVGINFTGGMEDDAMTALLNHNNSEPVVATAVLKEPATKPKTTKKSPAVASKPARGVGVKAAAARPGAFSNSPKKPDRKKPGSKKTDSGVNTENDALASSRPSGPIKLAESKKLIASLRTVVTKILPEMNAAFFSYMDEELLKLARDAKTNSEQSEYFAAMSNLEKAKKSVGQSFINEILDHIDHPRDLKTLLDERRAQEDKRKAKQATKVKLSLINTEEFEDWLAVANIISRSERSYEKFLQEIRARLGMLVDSWSHVEANPIGTSVFTHAFEAAIREVDLTKEIRQKVYSGFESKAIPLFRKLYISVIKLLEESKLFPDFDEDYITPVSKPVSKKDEIEEATKLAAAEIAAEAKEALDEEDDLEHEFDLREELKELRSELGRRKAAPSRNAVPDRSAAPSRSATPSRNGRGKKKARRSGGGAASGNSIFNTVRNLISRHREEEYAEEDELVEFDEVQELLSAIQESHQDNPSQRINVREQLRQSSNNRQLSPEVAGNLEVVESLVDTIESDSMLSGSTKDWVRQLELTLDKVALQEDNFLSEDNPHQAMEVINQLARLGGSESGSVRRNVDNIIESINANYDGDAAVFDDAVKQLQPLVERQSRAFTGNVQRTVKASEGQQTLVSAQRAVVNEVNSRLSGKEVPEVLMRLLLPGWRNLLVNTHLRQGQDSADWKQHVQAMDQVFKHLDGTADPSNTEDYIPPEALLEQIEQGLDSISFEPGQRVPLVNSLRELLVEGADISQVPTVKLEGDKVAETLGFADVTQKQAQREELRKENEHNAEWLKWLDRASNIHVGDWLEFGVDLDKGKEGDVSIVAWTNEDNSNFVFVNRRGVKTYDLLIEALAVELSLGRARVLEETDLPLADRASHRMLQNMHNQLTHQASHDELTGLPNRKEFERCIEKVLADAKSNNSHHIVAYMDLDQFKVINNAAGHDAGDQLLIEIGKLLTKQLEGSQFVVSRLGGDEFGILIENCEKSSGVTVVKRLSDAIKANQFDWEGSVFTLTTSCGLVAVTSEMDSVSTILRGADTACYAAKEAGRDRLQTYEADDSDMERRRGIMEFVSQIDKALKEDRFELHCQKIDPINKSSGDKPHYEILLTVLDENDNPMPPQDFIIAAETYNRMGAIDRWVIKNAFQWIASNILKLEDLGAFSINVSGNSLTEDDFMEFVLEQFNETRLPTSKICFEITETAAIGNLDDVVEFMERLKVIGVEFSLDDFGTGLSSYSYLRNLPVDFLKIDGIFVKDIKTNPSDYAVVKSINEIGHFMGKKTIAEFVEDDEVLEILREIGVDFAQGYGIEKKMPITNLLK